MAETRLIHVDPLSGLQTYTAVEDGKDVFSYHLPDERKHVEMAQRLKDALVAALEPLLDQPVEALLAERARRFDSFGAFRAT